MAAQTSSNWAMPPPMVAMATQIVAEAGSCTQMVASGTSMAMLTRLSRTGAKAAAKNRPSVLRMAP